MPYIRRNRLGSFKKKKEITGREVKPYKGEDGRMKVKLINNDGIEYEEDLAILIAKTFIPNPNNYQHVEFIDGNPNNCRADNLKWVE